MNVHDTTAARRERAHSLSDKLHPDEYAGASKAHVVLEARVPRNASAQLLAPKLMP